MNNLILCSWNKKRFVSYLLSWPTINKNKVQWLWYAIAVKRGQPWRRLRPLKRKPSIPLDSVGDKDRGGGAVKALLKTSCVARKCIEEIPNVCKKCHNFSIVSYDGSQPHCTRFNFLQKFTFWKTTTKKLNSLLPRKEEKKMRCLAERDRKIIYFCM